MACSRSVMVPRIERSLGLLVQGLDAPVDQVIPVLHPVRGAPVLRLRLGDVCEEEISFLPGLVALSAMVSEI